MARPSFLFISIEYDEALKHYHARLPLHDPFGANGAVGPSRDEAVANLYLVMDTSIVLCEEHQDDTVTVWIRPVAGPIVTVKVIELP